MSVINQMLNDLSSRSSDKSKRNTWFKDLKVVQYDAVSRTHWYLVGGAVLTLCLGGIYLGYQPISEFFRTTTQTIESKPLLAAPQKSVLLPPKAAVVINKPKIKPKPQPKPTMKPVSQATVESANQTVKTFTVAEQRKAVIRKRYQRAMRLLATGYTEPAQQQLKKLSKDFPDYHPARISLISEALKSGHLAQAFTLLEQGLALHPDYLPYIQLQATLYYQNHQMISAIKTLESHTPAMMQVPQYYALLAGLYQKNHQSLQAERLYQQLLAVQPKNGVWWMALGLAYQEQNKLNQAKFAFQQSLKTQQLPQTLQGFVSARLREMT